MKFKTSILILAFTALATGAAAQDLFEEAGHAIGHSRWVNIRFLPAIDIALEADDVVLVQSIEHPAKGIAMRIDGQAVAADCAVTETKDTEYSIASETNHKKKSNWATATASTSTTYWSKCPFDAGVSAKARSAGSIIVQVAMTNGNTKPHPLKPKELAKFQRMDQ